jgi:hypothetical protein
MRWAVTVIAPDRYPHAEAFREVAESVHYGLLELGHDSVLTKEIGLERRRHIVFGSNLLAPDQPLPPDTILFNLEQITPGSPWLGPELLAHFRRYRVWDYSRHNIARLEALGIRGVGHVPIGYVPQLERIPNVEEDLDVLFVGSLNPRRLAVLEALAARGLEVRAGFGVYGAERDALIARARIQLNVHFYEARVFEIVRVSYLLANGRFVVSETGAEAEEEASFASGVAFAGYDGLVETCVRYARDPAARAEVARRGQALMRARPMARSLRAVTGDPDRPDPGDRER